jgi:hypothetical protein
MIRQAQIVRLTRDAKQKPLALTVLAAVRAKNAALSQEIGHLRMAGCFGNLPFYQ